MGYVLAKFLGAILTPGTTLLVTLVAGSALLWSKHWRVGRALLTATAAVYSALALTPVEPWLTAALENRFPAEPALPPRVDGIIVLGGAIDQFASLAHGPTSFTTAVGRLIETARLSKRHPEARLLITGGSADPLRPETPEAPLAANVIAELGIARERIMIESRSRNTHENAEFSLRLADPQPGQVWVLVTSARHMPRAMGVFRRLGWPVVAWPVDFTGDSGSGWASGDVPVDRLRRLDQSLHEWIGLLYYRSLGWTESFFPGR